MKTTTETFTYESGWQPLGDKEGTEFNYEVEFREVMAMVPVGDKYNFRVEIETEVTLVAFRDEETKEVIDVGEVYYNSVLDYVQENIREHLILAIKKAKI